MQWYFDDGESAVRSSLSGLGTVGKVDKIPDLIVCNASLVIDGDFCDHSVLMAEAPTADYGFIELDTVDDVFTLMFWGEIDEPRPFGEYKEVHFSIPWFGTYYYENRDNESVKGDWGWWYNYSSNYVNINYMVESLIVSLDDGCTEEEMKWAIGIQTWLKWGMELYPENRSLEKWYESLTDGIERAELV